MSIEPAAPRPAPAFTADEERPITGRPFLVPLYVPHFTARSLARRRSRYGRLPQEGPPSSALLWVTRNLPPSVDVDRVDVALGVITLQACQARVGDPFAVGRIGRRELILVVVDELGLIPSAGVDRIDLRIRVGVW